MKNEININDELIAKYLSGEASPEEAMALDDWLQEADNRSHFEGLQYAWNTAVPRKSPRPLDVQKAWDVVDRRKNKQHTRKAGFSVTQKNALKIAASIVLLVSSGLILYLNYPEQKSIALVVATSDSLKRITFSDHSSAVLNRNSNIVYPGTFGELRREVRLTKGEAFFNIAADIAKPFIINTPLASIKVVGTAFNVVVEENTLKVSVDEGKVLAYTPTDSVFLEAGKSATLHARQPSFNVGESDRNEWAYATNKLVFNNTSLSEVFAYVEKARNCSIQVMDPAIGNCKLTATFESVSTDYMLNLITEALNLSVTKDDHRTFKVEGNGCH